MRFKQKFNILSERFQTVPYIYEKTPREAQDPVDRDDPVSFFRMFSPDGFAPL